MTCVCVYHQNCKLKCEAFKSLTSDTPKEHMKTILCKAPTRECFMLECENCASLEPLKEICQSLLQRAGIEEIVFRNWVTTDRADLTIITQTSDDFINGYVADIKKLIKHDYLARAQATFFEKCKETLTDFEIIAHIDFAENYSHGTSESIQADYFSARQSSLIPVILYFKKDGKTIHQSLVYISDRGADHNSQFVRAIQINLINYIKEKYPWIQKILYFSDGSAAQFKNCVNFYYLANHEQYFGLKADWHYFATAHGKGAVDGVGGTIKRMLRLGQYKNILISTAAQAFGYIQQKYDAKETSIQPIYLPASVINRIKIPKSVKTVKGTQKFHAVLGGEKQKTIHLKSFSSDTKSILYQFK